MRATLTDDMEADGEFATGEMCRKFQRYRIAPNRITGGTVTLFFPPKCTGRLVPGTTAPVVAEGEVSGGGSGVVVASYAVLPQTAITPRLVCLAVAWGRQSLAFARTSRLAARAPGRELP